MKWTEETIETEIKTYVKKYETNRMPTASELRKNLRGDLVNAIAKNGGFENWAQRLKLTVLLQGHKQLSVGQHKSIYDKYLNAYYLILKYLKFYNEIRKAL